MRIEATDYADAAQERLSNARLLYEATQYSFALYAAGVAVESLLRAYIVRREPKFDAAHDLPLLLKISNLRALATPSEYQQIGAAMADLFGRWRNDLRYTSNNRLRRYLKSKKLDRRIRGDFLKENCRIAIEMAAAIIKIGAAKWKP